MEILAFIVVSFGVIIIPGPNVLVVISTSITHGRARGLQTVAGTSTAMILQLIIAAFSTGWFVSALTYGFVWLKWFGVTYLFYLGTKHLLAARKGNGSKVSATGSFKLGFWVSLTNPKTILFFGAFLPQFVDSSSTYLPQIGLLSAIFWLLAVLLDSAYAILASQIKTLVRFKHEGEWHNITSGVLYLGASIVLASKKVFNTSTQI